MWCAHWSCRRVTACTVPPITFEDGIFSSVRLWSLHRLKLSSYQRGFAHIIASELPLSRADVFWSKLLSWWFAVLGWMLRTYHKLNSSFKREYWSGYLLQWKFWHCFVVFFFFLVIFWLPQFSDAAVANILWREEGTAVKFFCHSDNVLVCFSNSMMGHSPLTCH